MSTGRRDDRHNKRRRRPAKRPVLTPPHITVTDTDAEEDWAEPSRRDVASDVGDAYQSRQPAIDELFDETWADDDADNEAEGPSWRDSPPDRRDEDEQTREEGERTREEDGRTREEDGSEDHSRTALTKEEEMLLQTAVPYGARSNTPSEWGFGHSRAASRAESADEDIPEELEGRSRSRYKNVAPRVDSRRTSVSVSHTSSLQDLSQRQEVHRRDKFASTRHVSLDLSPRPRSEDRIKPRKRSRSQSRSRSRSVSRLAMKKEDNGYETDYDQVSSRFAEAGEKWRAKRIFVYKNGDPWFQGWEMRFVPTRDSMDNLYKKISDRFGSLGVHGSELSSGIRHIFNTDGTRVKSIDELTDGSSYVASPTSKFQKAPYGMKRAQPEAGDISPRKPRRHHVKPLSPVVKRVFGSKNSSGSGTGSVSGSGSGSGKHGGRRSGDGCKIKIINNLDKSIQSYVLVNLKTTQRFEDVLQDLGQVIKMKDARKMYTTWGQEVKSFSQLRNDFYETDTFYLCTGEQTTVRGAKITREEPRKTATEDKKHNSKVLRRHNSEPLLQGKEKKKTGGRHRSESIGDTAGTRRATDQVKVSLLGRVRTFHKASKELPVQYLPPEKRLKLAWVHGYRGVDAHHNLWVLPSGELLYYVAAVAVILNRQTDTQRHYTEHSEDIMCMDLHPSRNIAASGQRAGAGARAASVRVWGVDRLDTLHVFGSRELQVGVAAVSFSLLNQGAYLLAIDAGDEHLLTVWTWHNEQILGKVATHQDHVYGAKFHPMDNNLIITYGKHHLTFWNKRRDGIFDAVDVFGSSSARTILSVEFEPGGDLITGDSDGYITTWTIDNDGQYYKRVDFEAHSSAVTSLLLLSEVTLMSGGERDRRICAWDCSEEYVKRAETRLPEAAGGIRTLCPQHTGASDGNVYAGTIKNMILEGSIMRRFNTVVFGHSKHLWALATCHDDDCFVTAGYDRLVVKWSDKHKVIWKASLNSEAVSCAIHPLDTVVAVGAIDGHLTVFKLTDGSQVGSFRVCGQPLSCLSYSPGGDMLAVGAQTGSLYPYKVGRDGLVYVKFGPMQGSQPLTHIDWSTDGEYLQSVTVDHELILWNKRTLAKEKFQHNLRDKNWATFTCTVGYPVLGAWPELQYDRQQSAWTDRYADSRKARVLVTACRSRDHDLLAVGDSEGAVQLYRYPCPLNVQESAQCHSSKPQSSYVAGVRFLRSGRQLVSVGGTDATLLQWKIQ